jgi:hypothetical protein
MWGIESEGRKPYPSDVNDDEWAFAAPYLALVRRRLTGPAWFLAILLTSTTFGAAVTATVLRGYFVDAFIFSQLPFANLLIAPSIGLIAQGLHREVQRLPG